MPPKPRTKLTTEQRILLLNEAPTVESSNYEAKKSKYTLAADKTSV